jgi:translation initiation factor 5B
MSNTRCPICVVLGHVDHGKTLLLDKIRGSATQSREAGGITQAIGASIIPLETIKTICGPLLTQLRLDFTIPGLLFIDTPGHEAFTTLRKRGGSIADIAIVVVDMNEGFKPQTHETIKILISYKTPFVVAANKIDLIPGWETKDKPLLQSINEQYDSPKYKLEEKLYEIVAKIAEYNLKAERFDRVTDFTKEIAIIPLSAKTGEGIPEILMVLSGLAQRYLNECLECRIEGPAKGTILEVKEVTGLGTTVDAILYDGTLNVNDTIIIGGIDKPIVTKVRALLVPKPLSEMRDKKTKFNYVDSATAATGVKIVAPDLDKAIAGMPMMEASGSDIESIQKQVDEEIQSILVDTDKFGIIIKADTLGSLEALTSLLKKEDIPVRKASIGTITKKDVSEAQSNMDKDPLQGVILGFNINANKDSEESASEIGIKIITNDIIYKLIDDYKLWFSDRSKFNEAKELDNVARPCKVEIMRGYVFRQNNPAVVGVDVLGGTLKAGSTLMKAGGASMSVKSIQHDKDSLAKADKGMQVAAALVGVSVGRQINEGDVLYSQIEEADFKKLKDLKQYLRPDEKEVLMEIARIMRDKNPVWGV